MNEKLKKALHYFSPFEKCLWLCSITIITLSFLSTQDFHILTLIASLLGVTALIFIAKGNVIGQAIIVVFSLLYAIVSYENQYYGELATYVFMTLPSSVVAIITWMKNPSKKGKSEVRIAHLTKKKLLIVSLLSLLVTFIFYFILKYFNTANLIISTISVTTSFFSSSLTILRSPYHSIGYCFNDVILIVLWILASFNDISYLPMVFCFLTFLANDIYTFISWRKIQKEQAKDA